MSEERPKKTKDRSPKETGLNVVYYTNPHSLICLDQLNSTAGMNVVHNALYARQFSAYADRAGINSTCYWTDYHGMTKVR